MLLMLDTDTCSYIIKKRPISVLERLEKLNMNDVCISVITCAELYYGVERSSSKKINRQVINEFLRYIAVLSWTEEAAIEYGIIRNALEKKGDPIGNMDTMIAAHARSCKAKLVTNNTRHFSRVPKLKLENWIN